jgi:GT2 family glycosyltransferase
VVDDPAGSRLQAVEAPPPARELSFMAVLHGWPEDTRRWLDSILEHHSSHDCEVVLVDNSEAEMAWGEETGQDRVRVLRLRPPGGFGAAVNQGLHAATGEVMVLCYCMAFNREAALAAGGFDEKFRFYRIADFEFSFRLREATAGRALVVAGLPLLKHTHRLWESTPVADRERLSKKNFYRFLDRWGTRQDLLLT